MRKDIHPKEYRLVVFKDMSNDYAFMTKSCVQSRDTIVWEDGKEYPLFKLEISHTSHPFYTGKIKLVDTAGRIDKFNSRYRKHIENRPAKAE
jgi:large subunit ribosomal protein L31